MLECSAVRSPCTTFSVKVFLSFFLLKSFHYSFQAQRTELLGRGRIFQILDRGATPNFFLNPDPVFDRQMPSSTQKIKNKPQTTHGVP